MDIKSTEFFTNLKSIPAKNTKAYDDLALWEREKCIGGVNLNGIYIPGWLYWHINHWHIRIDKKDNYGNIVRVKSLPYLRDNEWERAEALQQCIINQEGYIEIGLRQGGKSEYESSYGGYTATMFSDSQVVVVGGSDPDLALIKDKIKFGINNGWEGIVIPFLDRDWRKPMVRLGYKYKDGSESEWSYIVVRNVAAGKNTEGPAGVTAKGYISDEIGKYAFAQAFEAAKPAFMSEFGWRCCPILVGTGGAFERGSDAERFFYHPKANKFKEFKNQETGEVTGFFMSGLYRQDCKYDTNLGQYLIDKGTIEPTHDITELSKILIKVSDKIKAFEIIKQERAAKALDPDQTEYLKLIMYYPLTPKECFLSSSENFFNADIARQQKDKLLSQFPGLKIGMYVDLIEGDNDIITHKPSTRVPISTFPKPPKEDANCPVIILEHPVPNPPYGLYVVGIDPYRFEKAPNSDSLGAAYVFKRSYDALSDSFQNMIVAWYVARPDSKDTWNNNVRLLIKYYNALALCENDEMSFIDYMIGKKEGHLMMDTPEWIKEYNPKSSANQRSKGISSSPKNIELFNTNLKQYMEEYFAAVPIPGQSETRKILGVSKINDPCLLDEIIKYNKDGNFDRIRAVSIAITCAMKLDSMQVRVQVENTDPRFQMPKGKHRTGRTGRTVFKELSNKLSNFDTQSRLKKLFK